MKKIAEGLEVVRRESGTSAKECMLELMLQSTPALEKVLKLAYDPYIHFGVKQVGSGHTSLTTLPIEGVLSTLNALANGAYGQGSGQARWEVLNLLAQLHTEEERDVVKGVLAKDLRIGMRAKSINKVLKRLDKEPIPSFDVMLASKDLTTLKYPCWVEPKLDGVRCIAVCDEKGEPRLYSRSGKEFTNFPEVVEALGHHSWPNVVFDGEIVAEGGTFQDLMTLVRAKTRPSGLKVKYIIFDRIKRGVFEERGSTPPLMLRGSLRSCKDPQLESEYLGLISGRLVECEEELWEVYRDYLSAGYEGAVAKNTHAQYEFKKSKHWVKMKASETHDLEVIGWERGQGKCSHCLGKFICDFNGVEVGVGGGYSDTERVDFWASRHQMIGVVIEVEAHEKTRDGSLRHPRFVRIREDK